MIIVVGVAHVIDLSEKIEKFIENERPDAVCIELDVNRLYFLLNNERPSGHGIFSILGKMQMDIAKEQNVVPGEEMITAFKKAGSMGIDVYLIDRDINETVERIKNIPFFEKLKLFLSVFYSIFPSRKRYSIDEMIKNERKMIEIMRKSYPHLSKILMDERENYMAEKIKEIKKEKIIAFVGDGHIFGLKKIIDAQFIPLEEFLKI